LRSYKKYKLSAVDATILVREFEGENTREWREVV
jgi:hypothetical protein